MTNPTQEQINAIIEAAKFWWEDRAPRDPSETRLINALAEAFPQECGPLDDSDDPWF